MINHADPHQHVIFVVAIAVSGVAGFFDWRRGEIPNWLTYGALLLAPLGHAARHLAAHYPMQVAVQEAGFSLAGALLTALVPLLLYRQGALGGGDLKLCAAIGALLQSMYGIEAEMYGFFAATLMAPAKLAYDGKLISTLKNSLTIGANVFVPKEKRKSVDESALSWFRLGPPLCFGVLLTVYLHW
jgi:prepilin peptidase CpaA